MRAIPPQAVGEDIEVPFMSCRFCNQCADREDGVEDELEHGLKGSMEDVQASKCTELMRF